MARPRYTQVRKLDSADAFLGHVDALGIELPFDRDVRSGGPLAQPLTASGHVVGNRFAILPMEGWDATADGRPTELVTRRWERFGESGAKLIWGGEAVAVRQDGRANPNQLLMTENATEELGGLREKLIESHARHYGDTSDLLVGLQLTHSGRFARPDGDHRPRIAYRHPVLDDRVGADDASVLSDDELDELVGHFVHAAGAAAAAGFAFVDVKHCHGYLGHELLSAVGRPGRYGGDLDGRTNFLRSIVEGIRASVPGLAIGVRLSAFDMVPFVTGSDGIGIPESAEGQHPFGGSASALDIDLTEPSDFCGLLTDLGIDLLCMSGGSPYYNPHIQRPAFFPPSDGYQPPEDPLIGVARLLAAARDLKISHPGLTVVGSGWSYLQEWLPSVAQAAVADGWVDSVGIGRMALSYPTLPADVLAGRDLQRKLICRTFSDCTTAPRNGLVSGCYPLDPLYKARPERVQLAAAKRALRGQGDA